MARRKRAWWAWARARSRAGLLSLLALFAATMTVLVSLTVAGAGIAATAASRTALADHLGDKPSWSLRTRLAEDSARQDAVLREAAQRAARGLPLQIGRQLYTEAKSAAISGRSERVVLAWVAPTGLAVQGSYPKAGEVLVPANGTLGTEVGQTLKVGGRDFTVSGKWAPPPAPVAGGYLKEQFDFPRLMFSSPEEVTALDPAAFVLWDLRLDPAHIDIDTLGTIGKVAGELKASIKMPEVVVRGLSVTDFFATDGGQLALELQRSVATARGVGMVPAGLLVATAVLALLQLTGLLTTSRSGQIELLVARGATPGRLARGAALETGFVSGMGALLGGLIAAYLLAGLPGGRQQLPLVVAVGLTTLGCAGAGAYFSTRRLAQQRVRENSSRARKAIGIGVVVLLVALAGLSAARFAELGSVVAASQLDWLAVLALPAAVLLGAAVALVALGPATALIAQACGRLRGLGAALASRQVARSLKTVAVPALLVSLSAATLTLAATFDGTTTHFRLSHAAFVNGAPIRVVLPAPPPSEVNRPVDLAIFEQLDGVARVIPVRNSAIAVQNDKGALVALPARDIAAAAPQFAAPRGGELAQLAGPSKSVEVPAGARTFSLTGRASFPKIGTNDNKDQSVPYTARATVRAVDQRGITHEWRLTGKPAALGPQAASFELTGELPPGLVGPVHVVWAGVVFTTQALDLSHVKPLDLAQENLTLAEMEERLEAYYQQFPIHSESFLQFDFELSSMRADGRDLPGVFTFAPPRDRSHSVVFPGQGEKGETYYTVQARDLGGAEYPLLLSGDRSVRVPAIVTQALAERFALQPGSNFGIALDGPTLEMTVRAVVAGIPGTRAREAALVDLGTLAKLRATSPGGFQPPNELWIVPGPGVEAKQLAARVAALAAAHIVGEGGARPVVTDNSPRTLDQAGPVRATFWIAGATAAVLALVGSAAAAAAAWRSREEELAVLRALGWKRGKVARSRAAELVALGLPAGLAGIALGAVVSALYIEHLARAATGALSPQVLTANWVFGAGALGALAGGIVLLGVCLGVLTRRRLSQMGRR